MYWMNGLFTSRFLYDPEGGAGEGSKTFTQDELNKILAEHKRGLQKELQDLKTRLDGETKSRGELEDMLIEAAGGEEAVDRFMQTGELDADGDRSRNVNVDDDEEGGIPIEGAESIQALVNGINKRHRAEMDAIRKRLDKEIETRENLETTRLEQDRDAMLADALVKNDVVDVGAGVKLFRDSMEYDEDLTKWRFKSKDGLYLDPDAGIAESLPDWMRKPMTGTGGSGSRGSSPGVTASQLTRKQAELAELEKKAKATGNQNDIMVYQKTSREVKELTAAANPQK